MEKLFDAEMKFMDVVWEHEPMSTRRLVELCAERLGWKRTTTYTVLKKLCDKGLTEMNNSVVTARVKREEVRRHESAEVLERGFGGSLPAFVAAFVDGHGITNEEAEEIKRLIDTARREGP